MKNLILAVFTVLCTLSLSAQEIPTEILTPAMVNQNNSMIKSNSLLAQARRNYLAGEKLPTGITLITTLEDYVGAFTKNNSRQMISDGAWIAKTGTSFFYQESTQSLHYVYCLNRVRTFQKLSSLVEPVIVYEKGETIFLPAKKEVVEEEYFDVDPNRFTQPQTFYTEPQVTCDDVVNAWDRIQANYTRRVITRRGAKIEFNQLRYQYSNCVAGFRPVWRNDGLKALVVVGAAAGGYYLGKSTNKSRTTTIINNPDPTVTPNDPGFNPGGTPNGGGFNGGSTSGGRSYSIAADRGMQQYLNMTGGNKSYVQLGFRQGRRNN